jgi:hypothetical protein
MASLRNLILEAVPAAGAGGRMVPGEDIVATCRAAGHDDTAIRATLSTLADDGPLCEADGHYARAPDAGGEETLQLRTHRGSESTPWQFSLVRTPDELVRTRARGPPEQFDPVVERFTIEERPLGADPVEFHHAVSRRVWQEDPGRPHVESQRSEGHVVEFLYRDPAGRHLARPEPEPDGASPDAEYEATNLAGVRVSSTYLRAETDTELKFTTEREYRVTRDVLDHYAEVYVLSYDEVNEESVEQALWEVDDAVAYRLVPSNGR